MPDRLPTLIAAVKTLSLKPAWKLHDDQFRFVTPLDIDGVTEIGLRFRVQCSQSFSDRNVTFQIEYHFLGIKFVPVTRVDWRPFNLHQNRNIGPSEWRMMKLPGSHVHPFQDNFDWMVESGLTPIEFSKENLPIAIPLEPEPATLEGAAAVAGRLMNIEGLPAIPAPTWEPRLL